MREWRRRLPREVTFYNLHILPKICNGIIIIFVYSQDTEMCTILRIYDTSYICGDGKIYFHNLYFWGQVYVYILIVDNR